MGVISDFITSKLDGSGASLAHAKYLLDKIQTIITQINELTTFTVFNRTIEFAQGLSITGTTPMTTPGSMWWDSSTSWMNIANEYPGSILQIGHELYVNVANNTGGILTDGTIIYLDGYAGNHHFYVQKALADSLDTARVLGIITNPIADGSRGKATVFGGIHGLNTFGEISGAEVYLSDLVEGDWTTTKPAIPIRIGYIGDIDVTDGSFLVKIDEKPPSIFASLYSSIDHSFPTTAMKVIPLEEESTIIGVGHSKTVKPEEITFLSSGAYQIMAGIQLNRTAGGASPEEVGAWLQKSTDGGTVWINIPDTLIDQGLLAAGKPARISANVGARFNKDDKLRMVADSSSLDAFLEHTLATATRPAKSSVMFSVYRLGD